MPKRHYPPSKRRYAERNPSITVRVTREEYDKLKQIAELRETSLNQLVREAAELESKDIDLLEDVLIQSLEDGAKVAIEDFCQYFICGVCGKPIQIQPKLEDPMFKWIVEQVRQKGWYHGKCLPKARESANLRH